MAAFGVAELWGLGASSLRSVIEYGGPMTACSWDLRREKGWIALWAVRMAKVLDGVLDSLLLLDVGKIDKHCVGA